MKLYVEGNLFGVFRNKDYKDKQNNDVRMGKWQLQFLTQKDMGDGLGVQNVLENVSLPVDISDDKIKFYNSQVGKIIKLEVGLFVKDKKIFYYGV